MDWWLAQRGFLVFDQGVSDLAPLEQSLNCHSVTHVQQVCHSKSLVTSVMTTTWNMKLTPASPKSACKYHYGFCKATIGLISLNTDGLIRGHLVSPPLPRLPFFLVRPGVQPAILLSAVPEHRPPPSSRIDSC